MKKSGQTDPGCPLFLFLYSPYFIVEHLSLRTLKLGHLFSAQEHLTPTSSMFNYCKRFLGPGMVERGVLPHGTITSMDAQRGHEM